MFSLYIWKYIKLNTARGSWDDFNSPVHSTLRGKFIILLSVPPRFMWSRTFFWLPNDTYYDRFCRFLTSQIAVDSYSLELNLCFWRVSVQRCRCRSWQYCHVLSGWVPLKNCFSVFWNSINLRYLTEHRFCNLIIILVFVVARQMDACICLLG